MVRLSTSSRYFTRLTLSLHGILSQKAQETLREINIQDHKDKGIFEKMQKINDLYDEAKADASAKRLRHPRKVKAKEGFVIH